MPASTSCWRRRAARAGRHGSTARRTRRCRCTSACWRCSRTRRGAGRPRGHLADLLQQARSGLAARRPAEARGASIAARASYDPGHVDLPDALARLSTRASNRLRGTADSDLRRDRLDRAARGYQSLLRDRRAGRCGARGVDRVADACAQRAANGWRPISASRRPRRRWPGRGDGAGGGGRAPTPARTSRARGSPSTGLATSVARRAERQRRVRGCLPKPPRPRRAATCSRRRATAPSTSCAPRARSRPTIRACAGVRAPAAGGASAASRRVARQRPGRASACLDARAVLEGEQRRPSREARRRLAQRWIAVGDERLGAGECTARSTALDGGAHAGSGSAGGNPADFASRVLRDRLRHASADRSRSATRQQQPPHHVARGVQREMPARRCPGRRPPGAATARHRRRAARTGVGEGLRDRRPPARRRRRAGACLRPRTASPPPAGRAPCSG